MSKSYRSLLWTGAILATVAACGDDVTVIAPPGGGINSVTVAPDQASIPVQGTVQMIAAVNADSGVATTVTWASSNPAVASISATGLVTGVTAGTVGITACSTVNTSACGAATVTVAAPVPATISIQSVTTGNTNVPVNINNVFGQIDVSLNFEPGSTPATSVELLLDGEVVASQGFSSLEWAALVSQAVEKGGELAKVVIVLSINTADFDLTTGVAKYFNGPRQLSARANLQGGSQVATPSQTLVFNNASGFLATLSTDNDPDANSAINPGTGLQWMGGDVLINLVGVSYVQGQTIASVGFTVLGKTRTATLTNGVATLTWSEGTTWTALNTGVGGYLSPAAGEAFTLGSAVFSGGQSVVPGVNGIFLNGTNATPVLQIIRLDNVGPGLTPANPDDIPDGIAQTAITQPLMTAVWVNATTAFAAGNAALGVPSLATLNASSSTTVDIEEGVDAITVTFFATAAGGALPSGCSTTGLTAITTGSDLAETTVSSTYRVRIIFTDALGNISCFSLAPGGIAGAQFGADFTAPTGTVTGPAAGPPGLNVDPGNFAVTASDNASGFDPAGGLLVIMSRLNVGGTTTCVIGSGTGCTVPAVQTLTFDATGGANVEGYYTTTITLVDQAGNETVLVTARLYQYDVTPTGFSGGISLPALIAGATTNTFAATATDNLDLNTIFGDVAYPLATLRYPSQSIGSWGPPLETSAAVSYAVADWIRCINAAGSFAVASGQPTTITLTATDQTLTPTNTANSTSLASAAFGANAQTCTGSVGNIAAADILSFTQSAPNYGAGLTQVDISGNAVAPSSNSVTLTAVADVALNSSADPFTRVDFFYVSGGVHIKIGTASVVLAQTVTNRTYTYTVTWDPDAAVPVGAVTVVALGVDAQGDAVLTGTQVVTTVP
jgi:hypothetical protein